MGSLSVKLTENRSEKRRLLSFWGQILISSVLTQFNTNLDQSLAMASAEDAEKKAEMNNQLKEYISQWREERTKEEAELKRLKDKQAARKEIRAEQEKKLAAAKRPLKR